MFVHQVTDADVIGIPFLERQIRIALSTQVGAQRVTDGRIQEVLEVRRLRDSAEVETKGRAILCAWNREGRTYAWNQTQLPTGFDGGRQEICTIEAEVDAAAKRVQADAKLEVHAIYSLDVGFRKAAVGAGEEARIVRDRAGQMGKCSFVRFHAIQLR